MSLLILAVLLLTATLCDGQQQRQQQRSPTPLPLLHNDSRYGDDEPQDVQNTVPVVQTQLGAISGRVQTAMNGKQYEAFRGIPYARPPVGALRFSKPQPHPAFDQGHFDAGEFGKMCWQQHSEQGTGDVSAMSEDCLFLNVFRPVATTDSSRRDVRPVYVYIHGGGFVGGSSSFFVPGQLVTDGNIIAVTLNYRVGALGFLSTGDSRLPGNYALWDQQLAIRWVKDNIQAFGGDPNQITIGGESAGSISVAFQSLSPLSKGLFNRAIMQSGAATAGTTIQREPLQQLLNLAREVRCPLPGSSLPSGGVSSDQDLLTCLRNVSPAEIMTVRILGKSLIRAAIEIVFAAVVDGEIIPKAPAAMLKDKEYLTQVGFYDRDYLTGTVNNEGGLFFSIAQSLTNNVFLLVNPDIYDVDFVPFLTEEWLGRRSVSAEEVVKFFYTYPRYSGVTQLDFKHVLDTVGDSIFYVPGKEFTRAIAGGQRSGRRNLAYFFDHYPAFAGGQVGTMHGTDLLYEFDMGRQNGWNADDDHLRKVFLGMIAGFVETGNPATALQSYLPGGWRDFDLRDESYLSLKPHALTIQQHLRGREASLWIDLLPRLLDSDLSQRNHTSTHVPTLSELIG
ncbi:bile salt-activated lipase-like [Pomacea canaliculata]|uniref:bile salt-activated lipase-like n=1 Tax=Pomacea canaliculata TaxID=400727 RepID=UPI000D72AD89|nr:bile salt-activated lipase-like [Pomacea canaliculata]